MTIRAFSLIEVLVSMVIVATIIAASNNYLSSLYLHLQQLNKMQCLIQYGWDLQAQLSYLGLQAKELQHHDATLGAALACDKIP